MGAEASTAAGSEEGSCRTGLGDLPERCVAEIMLRLDPTQICRLARLSRVFRAAASADLVWETKLPSNYRYLLRRAMGEEGSGRRELSKKEIFALLCRRNALDGEHTEFYLDKHGGLVCIEISSKALTIIGDGDRRYWSFIPTKQSMFRTVAYLRETSWLEVCGEQEFCFPEGTYSLFFRLHLGNADMRLGRQAYSPDHIRGFDLNPVRFQLSTSNGQFAQSKWQLEEPGIWLDYPVGDFVVENSDAPITVKFSMTQIYRTHLKRGIRVDLVSILPKEVNCGPRV